MNRELVESLVTAVESLEPEDYRLFQSLFKDKKQVIPTIEIAQQARSQTPEAEKKVHSLSLSDYEAMKRVWIPLHNDQSLFLVKIPDDCTILSENEYLELMKFRVMWMMKSWLEYEDSDKQRLQSHLAAALLNLHPGQIEPQLYDYEGEEETFEDWASDWANCLIEFNPRWKEWVYVTNSEVSFPANITPDNLCDADVHDEITIECFVSYLQAPFE